MSKTIRKYNTFEWIDLEKPTQEELKEITQPFNIDFNLLEDSLEQGHLPKIEKINDYTFVILRAYSAHHTANVTTVGELSNKIAFFYNGSLLITVHRAKFDFLSNRSLIYDSSEALVLDIFNEMLLTYEKPLHTQSDRIDEFEKLIFLQNGKSISVEALYFQKSKARISKKILQLTQNVFNLLTVSPDSASLLQDLKETALNYTLHYDEVIEDVNSILNTYLSITAKRSNDVMKLLTIFSAFFLPLTFIAGVYGMNFSFMPELQWHNGYFIVLGIMLLISGLIYIWFRHRRII
ncbi:MAG TPA: CorA family divalent cation transporter [Tenuifilaceae bacterium]|nr:CorA family divalent cation transporter [Tenuifilaceae bacterium]HOZ15872.1 CorA family divalent cation transporter [Tenuifilaceae bacterium]HPI45366.1 CorA family divalent cation transporter [Tenuifilaceae bacterium]HPN20659.1 CorA family divalent cation transporter [Tenuifilaceae bacterium]